jgi:hypothetical protein
LAIPFGGNIGKTKRWVCGKLGNFWRQQRKAKNALYIDCFKWGRMCAAAIFLLLSRPTAIGHLATLEEADGNFVWENGRVGTWPALLLDTPIVHMLLRRWMDTGLLEGMDAAWMNGRICNETDGGWTILLVEEAWAAGPFYWLKAAVTSSIANLAKLLNFRHLAIGLNCQ